VRILNGAHTSLVPVGYLAGIRTVKESMDDEIVSNHVNKVLSSEVKPILQSTFSDNEINAFITSVLDRFKNPTLKHFLLAISLNSTSKFQARLLPAFTEYTQITGNFPKRIAFSLACMIRFYKGNFNGEEIPVNDDVAALEFFKKEWTKVDEGVQSIEQLVFTTLSNSTIVGIDLTAYDGLVEYIAKSIENIESKGVHECLNQL